MDKRSETTARVVGGVDAHKDLHVAAVVDARDRVLGTRCFATTRQGYRQLLLWMRSFGDLQRVGLECTGTYGAGLLRHLQAASSTSWRSRYPAGRTGGDAARMTTSMPRMPRMPLGPGSGW